MENIDRYNMIQMDITLMKRGYDMQDVDDLFTDPFSTLYSTKIGFRHYPSAVGEDMIIIGMVFSFVVGSITNSLLECIVSDLYEWGKNSLSKVLNRKRSFDESRVILKFKDVTVSVNYCNKDDLIYLVENFIVVYRQIENNKGEKKHLDLMISDIIEFEKVLNIKLP